MPKLNTVEEESWENLENTDLVDGAQSLRWLVWVCNLFQCELGGNLYNCNLFPTCLKCYVMNFVWHTPLPLNEMLAISKIG